MTLLWITFSYFVGLVVGWYVWGYLYRKDLKNNIKNAKMLKRKVKR